jgi:putative protein-disulfide isomerase
MPESVRREFHANMPKQFRAHADRASEKVTVQLLTDPWSVWCWGFEPVRRTLELRYPTVNFRFLLGGMFPTMPNPDEVGFDVERFFQQVQRNTGMHVSTRVVRDARPKSTFPACIQVHAARITAPEKEQHFLRLLREAAYLDGENISLEEVAVKRAEQAGIDRELFQQALYDGTAESDFEERMEELRQNELYAYPTLLITAQGRSTQLEGFHPLPAVLGVVEAVSGRIHPPLPDPTLEQIIPKGERVATREVSEVLGIGVEQAFEILRKQEDDGRLQRKRYARGDFWSWV